MARVRGFERKTPIFLSIAAGLHAKLSFACPDARDQRFQDGASRAAQPSGQASNSAVGRSMPTSTDPLSSGSGLSGSRGLGGMLGKRTGAVLR